MSRRSLPAWECGLKFEVALAIFHTVESLPAWECGLKYLTISLNIDEKWVTPCVGVWIEIEDFV